MPFGEYLPFQDFLERLGLMQLTKVQGGFIAGDRHRAMEIPRAPKFLPLICYEIIFPGEGVPRGRGSPRLADQCHQRRLVRRSAPAPTNIFSRPVFGAIEEGLPLVRAANLGHFGGCRSARTHYRGRFRWESRVCSTPGFRQRSSRRYILCSVTVTQAWYWRIVLVLSVFAGVMRRNDAAS